MKRIFAAAAAAALVAGSAFAQTTATEPADDAAMGWEAGTWTSNLSHMQETVSSELSRMGIAAEVDDLTLRQLNELALILDDDSMTEQERIDQTRLIVEN